MQVNAKGKMSSIFGENYDLKKRTDGSILYSIKGKYVANRDF